ncbi:MAG: hypothetical protein C5B50_18815 [Verrucomicrobia bacterium]|nr:MAG: hypothetical protein C5B50_18815 [Verrucomicrobiota bacterium]
MVFDFSRPSPRTLLCRDGSNNQFAALFGRQWVLGASDGCGEKRLNFRAREHSGRGEANKARLLA